MLYEWVWSPKTQYINPMLEQYWSTVCDAGPPLIQQWAYVWCLSGYGPHMAIRPPDNRDHTWITCLPNPWLPSTSHPGLVQVHIPETRHTDTFNMLGVCSGTLKNLSAISKWSVPVWSYPPILCLYVYWVNPFSTGIDFRRQNLTSIDVRFWRLKSIIALKRMKYL